MGNQRPRVYLLNAANDDLGQRVNQWLHDLAGVDGAEEPTPEVHAVDVLPIVNRLVVLLQKQGKKGTHVWKTNG